MRKLAAILLSCFLLVEGCTTAYAAQSIPQETQTNETTQVNTQKLECEFSEPIIEKKASQVVYKTTVSVNNVEKIEGYEIHVENEKDVSISNKSGGNTTENVRKNGNTYFAAMTGAVTGEKIELCDIEIKYPYNSKDSERMLKIPEIQIVTSVAAEKIEKTGPYEIELPKVNRPIYLTILMFLLVVGSVFAGVFVFKKKKNKDGTNNA